MRLRPVHKFIIVHLVPRWTHDRIIVDRRVLRLVSAGSAPALWCSSALICLGGHLQQVREALPVARDSVLIKRELTVLQLLRKRISHERLFLLAFVGA